MHYSYQWLKELTNTTKQPEELVGMITLKGFELEETIDLGKRFEHFVVGKIEAIQKHPQADRLQLVKVNVGSEILDIVCGAWNINVGDLVPVALVGAVLPHHKITIEKREVRGAISNGMICAPDELGLGKDHSGILILDKSATVGQPLADALGLNDTVLDFSILPNRAHDCLSHEGMAREIGAMEGTSVQYPISNIQYPIKSQISNEPNDKKNNLHISIKDRKLCPRYIGAVMKNVKVGPSPAWMQARLVACGMEPINNVVDITNYVMLEVGNPLHAFDARQVTSDKSQGASIVVRKAKKGEQLELLDGKMLPLDPADLLITNGDKPLALAGIKGGKDSGINETTTEIVLEAANFNGFSIRKTRQRHTLLTESQARFEKGISPTLAQRAAERAIELLIELAGAELEEFVDEDFSNKKSQLVKLEIASVAKLLGRPQDENAAIDMLQNLGFELKKKTKKQLVWQVPAWRMDIEGPQDLIEEVGRITGYETIDEAPIATSIELPAQNEERALEWRIKDALTGFGMDEVKNYSFYGAKDIETCLIAGDHFEIENPLSPELTFMRKTLLVGILRNIAHNQKFFDQFALFEIGHVYDYADNGFPRQPLTIAGAISDASKDADQLFYALKGKIDALLQQIVGSAGQYRMRDIDAKGILYQPQSADIFVKDVFVGRIGTLQPSIMKSYGIKQKAAVFQIDFESIMQLKKTVTTYQETRKYPSTLRDVSLFVPFSTQVDAVRQVIEATGDSLLLHTDLFDVFLDKTNQRKSLAFHLAFGSEERTLSSSEVDEVMQSIIAALETKLQAEVRK